MLCGSIVIPPAVTGEIVPYPCTCKRDRTPALGRDQEDCGERWRAFFRRQEFSRKLHTAWGYVTMQEKHLQALLATISTTSASWGGITTRNSGPPNMLVGGPGKRRENGKHQEVRETEEVGTARDNLRVGTTQSESSQQPHHKPPAQSNLGMGQMSKTPSKTLLQPHMKPPP